VIRVALLLVTLTACGAWRQEYVRAAPAVLVDDSGVRGGDVRGTASMNGIGVSADLDGQVLEREEPALALHRRDFGAGLGLGVTVSPLGLLASNDRFTRWFDLGVAGSIGGGLVHAGRLTTYGHAWGGAWMAFGLWPSKIHPSLVIEVRREALSDWDDRTLFAISLALDRRLVGQRGWMY
jgi:hypothetical protein